MSDVSNRRKFLKILASASVIVPAATVASKITSADLLNAEPAKLPIDPSTPKAASFGYYDDATKVDTTKWPKRAGDAGSKQFCKNCQLLVTPGLSVAGQSGSYGACSLFPEGVVSENGWCNMWVAKVA